MSPAPVSGVLQHVIEERVDVCLERLTALKDLGAVVKAQVMASAFSSGKWINGIEKSSTDMCDICGHDVQYLFGRSYNRLEQRDFDEAWHEIDHQDTALGPLMRHMVLDSLDYTSNSRSHAEEAESRPCCIR